MKIYLVGGAVRDQLLGHPITERDWVVVGASPEEMIALGYRPVGKDFPVFLHPETHEEYALARTERSTGPGYKNFVFHTAPTVTLEEDLLRRDLTMNAIAQTPEGKIIDPFHGQEDLKAGCLRHVSPAFVEDPVRILRLARFAAHFDFHVAPETSELMREMVRNGEVNALVAERVWQECERALKTPEPQKFFEVLRNVGALALLFPELDRLYGVPNPPQWHPEIDTGIHTMMVLVQAAKLTEDPMTRFAALMHDLGKGSTPCAAWPSHHGHEERGVPEVEMMGARYKIPREYSALATLTARYHMHCHRVQELNASTIVKTLEALDTFRRPERFAQFLMACEADARGRPGFEDQPYPQRAYFHAMYEAAAAVSITPLQEKGYTGKVLGEKLHQARVAAVKASMHPHSGSTE